MLLYLPLRTVNLFMRIGYLSQLSPTVSHSLYLLLFCFIFYLFSWLWQSLPQQREEHVVCISTGFSIHWTKEDTIATLTEDDDVVSENNQHIHPPNPQQIRVSKAIDKMKERVTTEATPIPQVYRDTMNEMHINPTTSATPYSECSNPALYEVFIVPKEKRTVASKACNNLWCVIWWWLGAVFDKRAVSCTEPRQHSCICNREELVSYSTFEIAPRLFHQVLTVHCFKHGKQFPLVYCLLPENSRLVYDKCFSIIGDKVNNLGFLPVVQRITTNFEFALIQAAEVQFPRATSKGCFFFHFSQAVWRRVQHLGLQ